MIYLQLFWSFLKIGLFGFGGGYAIIPLIQHEIETHGWMAEGDFTDIIAISQITPGAIGINTATYVGYTATSSIWGSVVAIFAICLPSFIIMLMLSHLFIRYSKNYYLASVFSIIRPLVVGLIASAALLMVNTANFVDYKSGFIFAGAFIAYFFFKLHPILIIALAGILGFVIY
jgi:chromate transporter